MLPTRTFLPGKSILQKFSVLFFTLAMTSAAGSPACGQTIIEYHPNGKIHWQKNLDEDGLPHKINREYNDRGILIAERTYDRGVLDGISKLYYPSGELRTELLFKGGKRHGISLGYYKSGTLKDRGRYLEDQLDGIVRKYNSDGSLKAEMNFKNDRQEGATETYHPGGAVQHIYTYRKGRLLRRRTFDADGRLIQEQDYPQTQVQP